MCNNLSCFVLPQGPYRNATGRPLHCDKAAVVVQRRPYRDPGRFLLVGAEGKRENGSDEMSGFQLCVVLELKFSSVKFRDIIMTRQIPCELAKNRGLCKAVLMAVSCAIRGWS